MPRNPIDAITAIAIVHSQLDDHAVARRYKMSAARVRTVREGREHSATTGVCPHTGEIGEPGQIGGMSRGAAGIGPRLSTARLAAIAGRSSRGPDHDMADDVAMARELIVLRSAILEAARIDAVWMPSGLGEFRDHIRTAIVRRMREIIMRPAELAAAMGRPDDDRKLERWLGGGADVRVGVAARAMTALSLRVTPTEHGNE